MNIILLQRYSWAIGCMLIHAVARAGEMAIEPPRAPDIKGAVAALALDSEVDLSINDVPLIIEKTTLKWIKNSLGVGKIYHRGDAGESEYWMCYDLKVNRQPARVWLISNELGGPEHAIAEVYVETEPSEGNSRCQSLQFDSSISVSNLKIGSLSKDVEAALGKPSVMNENWSLYVRGGKVTERHLDRLQIVGFFMYAGRVKKLFLSQATTN